MLIPPNNRGIIPSINEGGLYKPYGSNFMSPKVRKTEPFKSVTILFNWYAYISLKVSNILLSY